LGNQKYTEVDLASQEAPHLLGVFGTKEGGGLRVFYQCFAASQPVYAAVYISGQGDCVVALIANS